MAAPRTPGTRLSPSQAVSETEAEISSTIHNAVELIPVLLRGNSFALGPVVLACTDAALGETLNGLSLRMNRFLQSVAVKASSRLLSSSSRRPSQVKSAALWRCS